MDLAHFILLLLSAFLVTGTHPEPIRSDKRKLIIGGTKLSILQTPYQAALFVKGKFICGGSVIGPRWVLTAAHCLDHSKDAEKMVRVGSSLRCEGGVERKVVKAIVHPKFSRKEAVNDIGLVLLEEPLEIDGVNVSCAMIPEKGVKLPTDSVGRVSGWGLTEVNARYGSPTLKAADLTVLPIERCQTAYPEKILYNETQYCIGSSKDHTGSCQGDSGGPFVVDHTVYGVVSWAKSCAEIEYPTIFTNVAAYEEWIRENVAVFSPHEKLSCGS
ncbi:trypsin-6-like [Wyeomyia smithii]|uniref:trypsin-6-like n=1 Tax=Wyeomyia smithii TaxID=174621 RepID=UPI002467EBEC|nr:trypsin-6-like [Wyeomyia smithii]